LVGEPGLDIFSWTLMQFSCGRMRFLMPVTDWTSSFVHSLPAVEGRCCLHVWFLMPVPLLSC